MTKVNKSEMMKKAHAWAKANVEAVGNYLVALKIAMIDVWHEVKTVTLSTKEILTNKLGYKVWAKGDFERIYINDGVRFLRNIGVSVEIGRRGFVKYATFNGKELTHNRVQTLIENARGYYYDCKHEEWVGVDISRVDMILGLVNDIR